MWQLRQPTRLQQQHAAEGRPRCSGLCMPAQLPTAASRWRLLMSSPASPPRPAPRRLPPPLPPAAPGAAAPSARCLLRQRWLWRCCWRESGFTECEVPRCVCDLYQSTDGLCNLLEDDGIDARKTRMCAAAALTARAAPRAWCRHSLSNSLECMQWMQGGAGCHIEALPAAPPCCACCALVPLLPPPAERPYSSGWRAAASMAHACLWPPCRQSARWQATLLQQGRGQCTKSGGAGACKPATQWEAAQALAASCTAHQYRATLHALHLLAAPWPAAGPPAVPRLGHRRLAQERAAAALATSAASPAAAWDGSVHHCCTSVAASGRTRGRFRICCTGSPRRISAAMARMVSSRLARTAAAAAAS